MLGLGFWCCRVSWIPKIRAFEVQPLFFGLQDSESGLDFPGKVGTVHPKPDAAKAEKQNIISPQSPKP